MYRLFLLPESRLQLNDRLNGICFFGEVPPRYERAKRNETPLKDRGRNCIQTERQKNRKYGSGEVAYRNEQGNCIDSFRSNRHTLPITL